MSVSITIVQVVISKCDMVNIDTRGLVRFKIPSVNGLLVVTGTSHRSVAYKVIPAVATEI